MSYFEKVLATLNMQSVKDQIWFHGRTITDTTFDLAWTGNGHDKEGPGFYFTSDRNDALGYASSTGIVLEVKLTPKKLASTSRKPSAAVVEKLMRASPNFDDALQNWDENPAKAFQEAMKIMMKMGSEKEVFQQVWFDFYREDSPLYLKEMIKLGYDGHIATWTKGIHHIIMYNPAAIKIMAVHKAENS